MSSPDARFRDLLAVPQMRAVLLAHAVSMVGSVVAEVALSVLVYARTGSSLLSAATLALGFLPHLLVGTVLSGVADGWPVRRLLVGCDLLAAGLVALMLVPGLPVAGLLLLVVLLGVLTPVFSAARGADLAAALPTELWLRARAALRVISQSALVLGFALGGLLLTALEPQGLLAVDAASFLASALLLQLGTPERPARVAGGAAPSRAEARTAVRLLTTRPRLRRLLLLGWLPWAFASAADGLAVTYSSGAGGGAAGASLLLCALAAGAVLGDLLAARVRPDLRRRLVVPWSLAMLVPLLGFALGPPVPLAAGLLLLVGLGAGAGQGLDELVLAETQPGERGRVLSVQSAGLMLLQGVGILGAGALAEVLDPGRVLALGAAAGLLLVAGTGRRLREAAHTSPVTGASRHGPRTGPAG